jgi:hypothetical protein
MPDESYRTFRLHRPILSPPPQRTVDEYTTDELAQLKSSFRPIADKYRRHLRITRVAIWIPFVVVGLAFLLATVAPNWLPFSLVFLWIASVWIFVLWGIVVSLSLKCPACNRQLTTLGHYCPACGQLMLTPPGWLGGRSCEHCGRALTRKRRHYKIKACSHCGVVLDEQGF